jgi:hypothetical protein
LRVDHLSMTSASPRDNLVSVLATVAARWTVGIVKAHKTRAADLARVLRLDDMSRISVAETLSVCGSTYRTIDLRVVAVKDGDHLACAFAAIRLTWESISEVRAYQKDLESRHEVLRGPHVSVAFNALRFSDWKRLCDDLLAGTINADGLKAHMSGPLDIESQANYLRRSQGHDPWRRDLAWPSLDILVGENPIPKLNTDHIMRAVGSAGYQSLPHASSAFCEADTWPNSSYNHNLLLRLPIFAALAEATVQPIESALQVNLRRHRKLKKVVVTALISDDRLGIPNGRFTLRLTAAKSESDIRTENGVARLPPGSMNGAVEISLSHPAFGELDRQRELLIKLAPASERNLLLEILRNFCSLETLEEALVKPAEQKPALKSDASGSFEQHVGWLLSLLGCSVIVLGRHESLKSGRVQVGSLDLIAVRGREVFLVACTLGAPKKEDFGSLWNLREILVKRLAAETNVSAWPLLVTGVISPDARETMGEGFGAGSIPILDVKRLQELVRALPTSSPEELIGRLKE